ncbi:synaptonemal complex protein 2-like [Rhynochetos jubatus]
MAQVEESGEQNDEATDNAAARTEGYLESLLIDAFKGKGFQNISELLQEGDIEPPQKYSKSLLNQLDKALRQELDRNEFQNVSLLLKCIQLYFKSDLQEETSLFIEQGLVLTDSFNFYLVSWFERAREFVILDSGENKVLMLLLEEFFDSALVICKCSNEGKKELVNLFLPELGHLVTEANVYWALRQEAVRTLNSILDSIPREERKKFPLSEEMCSLTKDLAKTILEVGDYDLQVALSEALCRLMIKKWRDDLVHHWFEDDYLAEAFKEIKDREFETDCRKFLNQLNARIEDGRRVYSLPCISAFADMNEVKKPSDEKLEAFWIDFNTGSQSVSFYVASNEGTLWESVKLLKEAVSNYSLKEFDGENIVKIYMKIPATFNKIEATKIQISFSAEFEILSILRKVLGEEKMMKAVNSGVTMTAVSQQTDVEDANQDSDPVTLFFSEGCYAEKEKEKNKKEIYDFENSDSVSHDKVAESKAKILGQKASSQNQRSNEIGNKNEESNNLKRRASNYRKHLFSESNNENTSSGQSEKSWILNSQKQSLPKSLDYTRKRPRVRSKLKDKAHLEEHKGTPPLLDVSSRDDSSDEEVATQKFDVSGKLSREEESLKRKESDTLSSTVIKKPKFSSWETSHRSSDASYKPRELLTSAGKEEEIQTGQEMDDGVDNAFSSKMLREDVSDSGLITAFESFISQLKKLFWTRYKRMETSVQNTLRTSEKNVSTLLDRIHECRMSKLETFHQTVVEELASLEKETQILENMEKDAVDFWNAQLLKLNSFCNQQKQRIQSIDSGLGETAKSFAEAVQNTTYEQPVKKAVENAVLIIPSD